MPLETSSGYLPDWLQALLGQGAVTSNAPVGLFSDTAARGSPAPNIGLLSSLPQFTGCSRMLLLSRVGMLRLPQTPILP
jgi:hypothetical protein